jgi:hypothetical protein
LRLVLGIPVELLVQLGFFLHLFISLFKLKTTKLKKNLTENDQAYLNDLTENDQGYLNDQLKTTKLK